MRPGVPSICRGWPRPTMTEVISDWMSWTRVASGIGEALLEAAISMTSRRVSVPIFEAHLFAPRSRIVRSSEARPLERSFRLEGGHFPGEQRPAPSTICR
jgi:hypothetical protein